MAGFDRQESTYEWAQRRGIVSRCVIHKNYYDPCLGCSRCREEATKVIRASVERKVNTLFENVIWLEDKANRTTGRWPRRRKKKK